MTRSHAPLPIVFAALGLLSGCTGSLVDDGPDGTYARRPRKPDAALPSDAALPDAARAADAPGACTPETLEIPVSADSHVVSSSPSANYGTATTLEIDASPDSHGYLRFDLGGLGESVASARLRLRVTNGSASGPAVHAVASTWTETGLTWSNRPAPAGAPLASVGSASAGWLEVELGAGAVHAGALSFVLVPTSDDGFDLSSRESGDGASLLVTLACGTPAVDAAAPPPVDAAQAPPDGAIGPTADATPTPDAGSPPAGPLVAFPGAEGFGAETVGGRGGAVIEVTNLNDSGAGSLRACVDATGPRTCVFRVAGVIAVGTPLSIRNPYITIAGQTAPGGGITLRTTGGGDVFSTRTSQVIMRYLSVRPGPGGSNHADQIASSGVTLGHIMLDHMTFSWGVDSNIETWYRVTDMTLQASIVSEALDCSTHPKGCHSKGIMIGGYKGGESGASMGSERISLLRNLIAHAADRTPLMQLCGIAQVINNVTYNPRWTFSHQQDNCSVSAVNHINWIGNYHKKGLDSTSNSDLKVLPSDDGTYSGGARVYVRGNLGPSRASDALADSAWVDSGSRQFIVDTPAAAPTVTTTDALTAYASVLDDAGNIRGLDCSGNWIGRRDAIDVRIVNDVRNGTGRIIDDPSDVGGWIVPVSAPACADADHDGMPDAWETRYGLDPARAGSSADSDGDGYTDLEEYLNGTVP